MILTALTDVDIVLVLDVLSQFDVRINFKKQLASPAREPSTPLEQDMTVRLLLNDPGFTFKGKNSAKEEGVEEVAKDVLRPCYREIHRVWMASARPIETQEKRKDRKIDRKSSMPWDKAGYKAQLGKDLQDIQHKLSRILGRKLAKNDCSFVKETSPVKCIEGGVLVDLCMQRSGKRGSGCDVPNKAEKLPRSADGSLGTSKGFPTPLTSSLMPPKPPRTKVRQHAWRRNEVCMHIRLLKPLETKKEEENHRKGGEVTAPHLIYENTMMSLSLSRQKSEGENQQYSGYTDRRKLGTDQIIPIYQCKTSMYSVKPSESRKEQKESQFKFPGVSLLRQTRDVMDDGITHVWRRQKNVNRLVARKRYAASEHSSSHLKEDHNSSLTISKQFLVQLAFIFIMVINVIRSGLNMNLLKQLWVIGLAAVVCGRAGSVESAVAPPTVPRDSFGGKRFNAYILPSKNVYASWMNCFDRYIKNLESEYRTMKFYKLAYLYICVFDSLWVSWERATLSSKIATLACNILYTLVYLLSEWSNSVIRIHDKYQRCFLVGLALTCKASSQIQYVLLRFRANWRELRPLVTPWANGIKESFKPCIGQKQFMPSYAQVSHFPLSLLSLLSPSLLLFYFGCCYYYYYCCYEYFTVKGLHKSSGYENKSRHENSNDSGYKTVTKLLSLFLLSSLPMLLTAVCGAGDLAHTVSSARFCLLLSFSLLMTAVCGAGDLAHTASLALLYILLSFSLLLTAVCGTGDIAHRVPSALLYILPSFSRY